MEHLNGTGEPSPFAEHCAHHEAKPPPSIFRNEPLPRLFKAVEQAFRQQFVQQMREEGISDLFPGAIPLILHLGDEDGLTLSELGKRCDLESSTMTPLVDELERHGLASRQRSPEDRRVIRLSLTPEGKTLEPRLRAILFRLQAWVVSGISEEELVGLRNLLQRMENNLRNPPEAPEA